MVKGPRPARGSRAPMAAEQEASWAELPLDLLTAVLSGLPSKDLAACAGWVSAGFCSHSRQARPQLLCW